MPDNVLEALIKAKDLISDPKHWTQGYFARNAEGDIREAWDKDATCWCAYGAVRKVTGRKLKISLDSLSYRAEDALYEVSNHEMGTVGLNDTGTHADVMAMFDRAIEAEKAKSNDQNH